MGDFDDILKKKINQLGISRQVEAVGIVEKATEEIAKIIPRSDFEVISFNRGTLKVKVSSSSAASEINLQKKELLKNSEQIKRLIIS